MKPTVLLWFMAWLGMGYSAKILGIFHVPSYSHYALGSSLLMELTTRGHEVTVISPYPLEKPHKNWKDVPLTGLKESFEEQKQNMFEQTDMGIISKLQWINMIGVSLAETVLNHTNVQTLLNSNEKFDLIIMEQFLNEVFKAFGFHFNAPVVLLSTVGPSRWTNPQVGNPAPPSFVPELLLGYSGHMNFRQRLQNFLVYIGSEIFQYLYVFPKHNELIQKYFPGAPHFDELYYNTSLILLNSHNSFNDPVPYVPNMIDIGGYHVKPPKALPSDLQEYLDGAKSGVIYFSMGSNLKSKDIPIQKRQAILKTLAKLKENVLWKFEEEVLPDQPPNIKLGKWLPQQDILAHPNIKLFITHGGLLSSIEAIYHGVPLLAIPVLGDQELNAANAAAKGYGISLPFRDLTEETFRKSIKEVLSNPTYSTNAKMRSKIMHDEPMKPLNKAVFWMEYVIRHKGALHLRTAALNLTWYQYILLDVIAFLGLAVLVSFVLLYIIIKSLCCSKKGAEKIKKT